MGVVERDFTQPLQISLWRSCPLSLRESSAEALGEIGSTPLVSFGNGFAPPPPLSEGGGVFPLCLISRPGGRVHGRRHSCSRLTRFAPSCVKVCVCFVPTLLRNYFPYFPLCAGSLILLLLVHPVSLRVGMEALNQISKLPFSEPTHALAYPPYCTVGCSHFRLPSRSAAPRPHRLRRFCVLALAPSSLVRQSA